MSREQTKFIKDLKDYLKENDRYIIIHEFEPKGLGKKEDRIKFILEPKVSMNSIYLRKDMADKVFMKKIEDQLFEFPNGKNDDVIDALTQAIHVLDTR